VLALLQEITKWVDNQPDWVSDAARRILENGSLNDKDIDAIVALLLDSVGLPDLIGYQAVRLDPSMFPAKQPEGAAVALTGIRNPVRINALANTDGISFEPVGLTIVYGYNGAGKSGYARALKSACRARDRERILPDVFNPPDTVGAATARFEWRTPAGDNSVDWIDGKEAHADLSAIAVFDSRCARLFVDDENEVVVVPYGLDILRELVKVFDLVKAELEKQRKRLKFDDSVLASLKGNTKVGNMVAGISPKTNPEMIKSLASLSPDELERKQFLTNLLGEGDPAKAAIALRRSAQRIGTLAQEFARIGEMLSDEGVGKLRETLNAFVAAEQASKIAAEELREGGQALKGTGSNPWRELVESAMRFAEAEPYTGESFPAQSDDVRCVLCQQPLGADAKARLESFVQFLEADTQKKAARLRNTALEHYKRIADVKPRLVISDKTIFDEIREKNPDIAGAILAYLAALVARQKILEEMAKQRCIGQLEVLPPDPIASLESVKAVMEKQADILEKSISPQERQLRVAELAELNARAHLAEMLPLVLKAIEAAKVDVVFAACIRQTDTRGLTKKASELQEKAIAAGLSASLDAELRFLGLAGLKINLQLRGSKGAGIQKLSLDIPKPIDKMKISDVLSEGEQRAIAIATFLAEASLSHNRSGIVFDDPVSSLDHSRRETIAKRLSHEAISRQVIVFTHDLAFVWDLVESAKNNGAQHKGVHVFSSQHVKGLSKDTLPHEGGKLDARINVIKDLEIRARKALEKDHDHETFDLYVRRGYGMLRDCWERLVEEVLFGETVRRFRNGVSTKNLKKAYVDDEDFEAIWHGMTRCSNFTHDSPTDAPVDLPSPDGFLADIVAFTTAFDRAKVNIKEVEKRRVAMIPAAR
jgi:hypothetical protein